MGIGFAKRPVSRSSVSTIQNEADAVWKNWRVFPNPVKDQLNFEFRAEQTGIALAEIVDYTGRTVYKKTFTINFGYNQRQIKQTEPIHIQ